MIPLTELRKLVKFLRKEGILEYKDSGLELKLDPSGPNKPAKKDVKRDVSTQVNDVPGDGPTREELLFWSSGGQPAPEPTDGN